MDLDHFFSRPSGSFSRAFESRHFSQNLSDEMRELAHRSLKLFPVSLTAKLNECPEEFISEATSDISLLEVLSAAAQPLWGYRLALGPSGLCVLILDGVVGRASLATLVPDLDECATLQARRGDKTYAFFRKPAGMSGSLQGSWRLACAFLAIGESCIVPPFGGAVWLNPGEIEELPFALRQLLAPEDPDTTPGRAIPAPKPSPRPAPCRPAARFPQPNPAPRKGHPVCGQAGWRRIPHLPPAIAG